MGIHIHRRIPEKHEWEKISIFFPRTGPTSRRFAWAITNFNFLIPAWIYFKPITSAYTYLYLHISDSLQKHCHLWRSKCHQNIPSSIFCLPIVVCKYLYHYLLTSDIIIYPFFNSLYLPFSLTRSESRVDIYQKTCCVSLKIKYRQWLSSVWFVLEKSHVSHVK